MTIDAAAKGKLFVISAPSGCGKTTLCKRLLADRELKLAHSVSMTTRPRRPEEKNGIDYNFVSRKRFCEMIKKREFLEYEDNFGRLYGTPRRFVKERIKNGEPLLLAIDVKGAMKVRRAFPHQSVLVFILPPSMKALRRRLRSRMSDSPDAISARISLAKRELSYKDSYDYKIVNDRLGRAYKKLKDIIISELKGED